MQRLEDFRTGTCGNIGSVLPAHKGLSAPADLRKILPESASCAILAGFEIGVPAAVTQMASYAQTNNSVIRMICGILFAFGLGMTRLAMMKYGVKDIRVFNGCNLKSLSQFTDKSFTVPEDMEA